jgi:hypothetical protein
MSDVVASPCVNVCTLDATGRVCMGCYRDLQEIAMWGSMSEAQRAAVLAKLPERRRRFEAGDGT